MLARSLDRGDDFAVPGPRILVLNVCAEGDDIAQARERAYAAIKQIDWPGGFNRSDIGWRALERG